MRLADFFIGKPGPGSLSEAVHMGLPVITFSNAWTMPQERWNTRLGARAGRGPRRALSFAGLPAAVQDVLADLPELRRRVRAIDNRAVFEVPQILAELLMRAAVPQRMPDVPQLSGALS